MWGGETIGVGAPTELTSVTIRVWPTSGTVPPSVLEFFDEAGSPLSVPTMALGQLGWIIGCTTSDTNFDLSGVAADRVTVVHRLSRVPPGYRLNHDPASESVFDGEPALVTTLARRGIRDAGHD